jgi:hypothetical protein
MSSANETQVAGTHYKSSYQHWDMVQKLNLGYFEGQITKYLTRHQKKNGLQDVEKAQHFLSKLTELAREHEVRPPHLSKESFWNNFKWCLLGLRDNTYESVLGAACRELADYCKSNDVDIRAELAITAVAQWESVEDLEFASELVTDIARQYTSAAEPSRRYVDQG